MTLADFAAFPTPGGARARMQRGEGMLLALMLAAALALVFLSAGLRRPVAWVEVAWALAPGTFLYGLGFLGRARARMPRLSTFLVAAGFYVNFGNLVGLVILMRFPFEVATIDPLLARVDAALGYDWPAWVAAVAARPPLGALLGAVYLSSLTQLVVVMATLAGGRRDADLQRFMLTGALGLVGAAAIWWAWPSLGPATLHRLPDEVAAGARLVVNGPYAAELLRLAAEGVDLVSPDRVMGVVAFPSFHIFMACMVVWFARVTPLRLAAVAVNLLMIPATLVHGGHHLVDLLGGVALFAAVTWAVGRLVPGATPGIEGRLA